jgi:membrane-associated phospholipid phosphatase
VEPRLSGDTVPRLLLLRSLAALGVCAALVALCYFLVDTRVAIFVHDHDLRQFDILRLVTLPPPVLETWAPAVMAALAVRRVFGPFTRWELTLLVACVSLLVGVQFKDTLKFCFGRYWPDTWINNNPSLIGDGAYGFHPFADEHGMKEYGWYGSFPSGHTERCVAIAAVYWVAYPRWYWRALCVALPGAVAVGLVGMNYHFVGDVVGGVFAGGIVGVYAAHCGGLGPVPRTESLPP